MANPKCLICGGSMKGNGVTKAGTKRWRCKSCGSSAVRKNDTSARLLKVFVTWLLGKRSQSELPFKPRTFRAKTARFWRLWPIVPICDEVHHVVFMDGIWLAKKCVVLIACTNDFVIGCHLARSENSKDWGCLMQRIAPPCVLVCDGGGGIEKARKVYWPDTHLQRCTFHAFCAVKRCTTTRPKTQAGVEIYAIAKDLMGISSLSEAAQWLARFQMWCSTYERFLKERSDDGKGFKHERLRKAKRSLEALCKAETLFTYLQTDLLEDGPIPAMSNRIENLNGQIRRMLSFHRGMNIDHRIKAVFWFCYMNSEAPASYAKMLKLFPDDEKLIQWRREAAKVQGGFCDEPAEWGQGAVWAEFHKSDF